MNVPAVSLLPGLCVCAAGGSKVGPGEGLGTLGSDGGFGGRCHVLLGLNGGVMGMVQLLSRGAAATGTHLWGLTEPSGWEEWGQRSRGGGAVLSLGGLLVLAGSSGLARGGRRDAVVFRCQLHRFLSSPWETPSCPVGTGGPTDLGAETLIGAQRHYLDFLHARSEMARTCCSTAVSRGKCRPSSCSWPRG